MVKKEKDINTEQKILEAARQVFMEKGMAGARMQDIADKAGINKALLHYYFRNKDKLFEVIFMEGITHFLPTVMATMTADKPLFEKIEIFANGYIDMMIQNPYLPLFVLNEINRQPKKLIQKIWGSKRPPTEKLAEQIREGVKKGELKPISEVQLMINMVSLCIFPILARPMVQWVSKLDDAAFWKLMEQRKKDVAKFIIDSIRK